MSERYDERAAIHYAAYRPPLHSVILDKALLKSGPTAVGLDVGCGTGNSAIALAKYCGQTYAFDSSPMMLARAAKHDHVFYFAADVEQLPLQSASVDKVTFAGSLFYLNRDNSSVEIRRVCARDAEIIVYDFEILLDRIMQRCGIDPHVAGSEYDHAVNLSGMSGYTEVMLKSERLSVGMSALELTHVLLSDSNRLDQFVDKYGTNDPSALLERDLRLFTDRVSVEVDIYYSKYRLTYP